MLIVEYRVPMPFCADEYRIGQLYTIAKKSKLESKDSKNGVTINVNEAYSNGPGGYGQYTNKTYYLANRMPDWLKRLLPESAAKLKEEAWNAYPYSKNKFTNPFMDKLTLEIESRYIDGPPTLPNTFNLDMKEEKARSIVVIDFANNKYKASKSSQSATGDNEVFAFDPLFRRPISKDWLQEYELAYESNKYKHSDDQQLKRHLMTCYKLCRVNFPVWPIQNKVEQFLQQYCRDTIIESHRQAWLWQDDWTGMSLEEIRFMEKDTQDLLSEVMKPSQ